MDKKEITVTIGIIIVSFVFFGLIFYVAYFLDRASCHDKAINYNGELKSYSFLKKYCFVEMPNGKKVNLENYRDIVESN